MDRIFMNSENSKTFKENELVLKLTDKLDSRFGEKVIALKIYNLHTIIINLKYQHQH